MELIGLHLVTDYEKALKEFIELNEELRGQVNPISTNEYSKYLRCNRN